MLKCSILLVLLAILGVLLWQPWDRQRPDPGIARMVPPPRSVMPSLNGAMPQDAAEWAAVRNLWQNALDNDGRVLESGVAVRATGLSARKNLQLALDEVFSLGREGDPGGVGRIRPRASRSELERFVLDRVAAGGPSTYPVLYVKDAFRVPGNLRIATGEIIALLHPGVPPSEIARHYNLEMRPASASGVGLTRFIARNAFRALEIVPLLAADRRIAMVDHDLIKPVEPKSIIPNDPFFPDQWAILPVLSDAAERDLYNIGLFPTVSGALSAMPNLAPVWGDFDEANDGFRGRGIKIGIVDDGLEVNHPDLFEALAPMGEHRAYDMVNQEPRFPGDVPPPRVQGTSGAAVDPIKLTAANRAHGVLVGGLIGARGNNFVGITGVAPNSILTGLRAFSYTYIDNFLEPPDSTFYRPELGDLISPTQDVIIAAAFEFGKNDFTTGSIPGKRIYGGTFYETDIPTFSDGGAGTVIHIKNIGFGAPDSGVQDAPGPEVAGVFNNNFFTPGARDRSLRDGRLGLGTIYVHPAGNGRNSLLDNSNNDGYANARGAIAVGALARLGMEPPLPTEDNVNILSEWGANLTVVAPGGGGFWRKGARVYDRRPLTGGTLINRPGLILPITTTDWTINEAAKPGTSTTPPLPALFGLNPGGNTPNEYLDGKYTRRFQSTSAAAAHVSGVIALMLEANPRLSWIDVQDILMRTARKHFSPDAYAADPGAAEQPPIPDAVDLSDPADSVVIDRDWRKNSGNRWFNHKYGAGLVDAGRAVAESMIGVLLPTQTDMMKFEFTHSTTLHLPDRGASATAAPGEVTMDISAVVPQNFVITHVDLRIDRIVTAYFGEVFISMTSPGGMESILLEPRFDGSDDLVDWTFGSLRHWGENGNGQWTITFRDYVYDGNASTVDDAMINQNRPGENGSPATRLVLHGYIQPEIPVISRPASKLPDSPTVVEVARGRGFNYTLTASGNPTNWFVLDPETRIFPLDQRMLFASLAAAGRLPTPGIPGLPPGIEMSTVSPSEMTTYQSTRTLSGRTTVPVGSVFEADIVAANAAGVSEMHFVRFLVVPPESDDPFTQWDDFHFPPFAQGNPDASGSADPDGDGYINALEFALGTSPVVADASGAVTMAQNDAGNWTFTFRRYPTRGVTYEVQVSDSLDEESWETVVLSDPDLEDPDPGAGGVPVSQDPDNYTVSEGDLVPAGTEPQSSHRIVTVVNDPASPPPVYYRLKVTPPRDPLEPE